MKRKFIILLLIGIIFSIFGWQVYSYNKYDGNLIIKLSNQSDIDTVIIELFIDGEKRSSDFYTNETFHNYKRSVFDTKPGSHKLLIKTSDNKVLKEVNVNTLFVTWVYVDFFEDNYASDRKLIFYVRKRFRSILIQ